MRRVLGGHVFDTEKAQAVGSWNVEGATTTVYANKHGYRFVHRVLSSGIEELYAVSYEESIKMLEVHGIEGKHKYDGKKKKLTIVLEADEYEQLKRFSLSNGMSMTDVIRASLQSCIG